MSFQNAVEYNFSGINDSTLREGEQYNGSNFSFEQQKQIVNWLHNIGIDTVEVGNPANPQIAPEISKLVQIKDRPPIMAHIRNKASDLTATVEVGVQGVHFLCTVDPARLEQMGMTLQQHINEMVNNVKHAQAEGLTVRVSVEHGLEKKFFTDTLTVLKKAEALNVNRIQVADTRGVMFPWEVSDTITLLRREITAQIGVHFHNDLGHATSNAVNALAAGANWVDTTLLGVGERTGITPLSALLVNLYSVNPWFAHRYHMSLLTPAETYVAEVVNLDVPHNLTSCKTAFSHKAGIHINGLRKQGAQVYEAFSPTVVGNQRIIVTGSRISGRTKPEEVPTNLQNL